MKNLVALLLLLTPFAASAQILKLNQGDMEASGSGSFNSQEVGISSRVGYFVRDYVQVGVDIDWASSDFADRVSLGLYGLYLYETQSYWLPYYGAGLGYGSVDIDGLSSESGLELTLFAGLKYYLTDNVSLNTELYVGASTGDTYLSDDELESTDVGLTIGLSYFW